METIFTKKVSRVFFISGTVFVEGFEKLTGRSEKAKDMSIFVLSFILTC